MHSEYSVQDRESHTETVARLNPTLGAKMMEEIDGAVHLSCHHDAGTDLSASRRSSLISATYQASERKIGIISKLLHKILLPSSSRTSWTSLSSRSHTQSAPASARNVTYPRNEFPEFLKPPRERRRSVKFNESVGLVPMASSVTLEHTDSLRSATSGASNSVGAMLDGYAFDTKTHDLLKAMQACMYNSLSDPFILQRQELEEITERDFSYSQKVRIQARISPACFFR